jgi:hypothetical protein
MFLYSLFKYIIKDLNLDDPDLDEEKLLKIMDEIDNGSIFILNQLIENVLFIYLFINILSFLFER